MKPTPDNEWITYLKETNNYSGYDGQCDCYVCQSVRDGFEKWKVSRPKPEPSKEVVGAKSAEEWALEMWQPLAKRFISGNTFASNIKPFIEAIQQDAYQSGLTEGLAKGREDKERLDWLQNNADRVTLECNLAAIAPFWFWRYGLNGKREITIGQGKDLRAAIDSAIENDTKPKADQ
jgi:hypothetical protein